jgi:hypothetical protein
MLTVSDIARVLLDCGDGVEVKADGRSLLTAQIEGTDSKYLNLVSQPEGVRLPAAPTLPEAAQDLTDGGAVGNAGTPMPAEEPSAVSVADAQPPAVPLTGGDQDGTSDLI